MINVIGIKRLFVLLVFLAVNVAMAFVIYFHLTPELEKNERSERTLRSQVRSVQADMDRLQTEFEQLDQQQERFDKLKEQGFFNLQSRSDAKKMFSSLQDKSKVISAVVSVKPGVAVDDPDAMKANHKVLVSPISVVLEAFDDGDVYRYIDLLQKDFPGHISIDSMTIERTRDVNAAVLRAISSGANPVMVKADLILSWRTMVPADQLKGELQ